MTAPSPYAIQAAMAAAQSALSRLEASGDVDTDEAAALEVLRQEAPDVDTVITRLLRAADEARANGNAAKDRRTALAHREARFERQHEDYRNIVANMLNVLGLAKWKSAEFTVSLTESKAGVLITDPAALPDYFVRIRKEPDKTAIACALREGREVPGATLTNGRVSMTVRTK